MSHKWTQDLLHFLNEVMLQKVPIVPTLAGPLHKKLFKTLIEEEIGEVLTSLDEDDIVGIADGVADSIWVLLGLAATYGIDINPLWDEVYKSNMAKRNGTLREDGKMLKPENWEAPAIAELLEAQGWKS